MGLFQSYLLVVELVETMSGYQIVMRFDRCYSEPVELVSIRIISTF